MTEEVVMRFHNRERAGRASKPTGYVGDHADKLSHVPPLSLDEDDERPRREDRDFGHNPFEIPVPVPRFLKPPAERPPRKKR